MAPELEAYPARNTHGDPFPDHRQSFGIAAGKAHAYITSYFIRKGKLMTTISNYDYTVLIDAAING